eukprot:scaffold11634_cov109-Cylindrotheca_fusiformis.AAC.10
MDYQSNPIYLSGAMLSPPRYRSQNPSAFKTPTKPVPSSSFQTPIKATSSRARRSMTLLPQMSPSPSLRRKSCSYSSTPTSHRGDRYIPSRRCMNMDLCRRALLSDNN